MEQNQTLRDRVERELLRLDHIKALTLDDKARIDSLKDQNFGRSFLGLALYANGNNLRGKSTNHPLGLIYDDGENFFGIGYFRKENESEDNGHLHIIAPTGPNWIQVINRFIQNCRYRYIPKSTLYIRHLRPEQARKLIEFGKENRLYYFGVSEEKEPWHPQAPQEDETFNNRRIHLDDVLQGQGTELVIKQGTLNKAYKRFSNFLKRNSIEFVVERYEGKHRDDASWIISKHFEMLNREGKLIGSTPEDYQNIIDLSLNNISGVCAYIGYLVIGDRKMPVMFFSGEDIGNNIFGLYSTIALRDYDKIKKIIGDDIASVGSLHSLSRYCYTRVFEELYKQGIRVIDIGGSETKELDDFKKSIGAKQDVTKWVGYL